MKLSRLPLLVQPLVYPALRSAAEHHVRHEKKTLNRTRCRAGVPLESVYRRALTDLKAPSAHSNSSIEQFCQEVNRICFNSWLSLTAEKHNLVLKVKWSMFFFLAGVARHACWSGQNLVLVVVVGLGLCCLLKDVGGRVPQGEKTEPSQWHGAGVYNSIGQSLSWALEISCSLMRAEAALKRTTLGGVKLTLAIRVELTPSQRLGDLSTGCLSTGRRGALAGAHDNSCKGMLPSAGREGLSRSVL